MLLTKSFSQHFLYLPSCPPPLMGGQIASPPEVAQSPWEARMLVLVSFLFLKSGFRIIEVGKLFRLLPRKVCNWY